ncbi:hypothetical protein CAPTEDRAFT_112493 [Capitella teleta]|uniref:Sushi domain-containing protein n=1 Tax=Capitella teleta TaxID=283909 RepID=R7TTA6_CAPTE|nr:hypothetical protein CAPTEDRAFT_112493 [Capitella teleta]|eukprot:ELT94721.1 hypothetical protein CAPTEDRAFT_112493 [Capitella teleta]
MYNTEASCGDPGYPLYGEIVGGDFSLDGVVQLSCSPGYRLIGSTTRTCLASGRWSGHDTVCSPVICGEPGVPQKGSKDGSIYQYPHNVTYSCFAGYTLKGASKLHCDSTGTWTAPVPECIEIRCSPLTAPTLGSMPTCNNRLGSICQADCNAGYVLSTGTSKRQCLEDGVWSGTDPVCQGEEYNVLPKLWYTLHWVFLK